MNTGSSGATKGDRLYFQRERECVAALHEMDAEAARLTAELLERLDAFDEIDESLAFEQTGGGVIHAYSGKPVPWLQQRRGEARTVLATTARHLLEAARELEAAARTTSRSGRKDHIARGRQALAAEALRVVESFGPYREESQVDWSRVYAICDGIDRLEDRQHAELRDEIRHDLDVHERYRRDMQALGMGDYVRDVVDADPTLQRALRNMREYVGEKCPGAGAGVPVTRAANAAGGAQV